MKRAIQPLAYEMPKSRAACQRLLINYVKTGHRWWTSGTVAADKAEAFIKKMCVRHGVDMPDHTRCYRRKQYQETGGRRGYPSVQLLIYPEGNPALATHLRWFLLSSERLDQDQVPTEFRERLVHLDDAHLVWNEYELVHRTRARKIGGGTKWTWMLTKQAYLEHLALFEMAAKKREPWRLKQLLDSFRNRPGWGGLRTQMLSLIRAAKNAAQSANGLPADVDWKLMPQYLDLQVWSKVQPRTVETFLAEIAARLSRSMPAETTQEAAD